VLPASIFKHIDLELASAAPARPSLSGALARMLGKERWLACEVNARRFNLGEKYGLLTAQLALALAGKDRDEVLTQLTDLLAQRGRPR
jgi:UTP--glucose-1-phosphate uridylyltransferase